MILLRTGLIRALVKGVGDAILIAVRQWATVVFRRAGLIRALVKRIRDAIAVPIRQWTAVVLFETRFVRALVEGIRDAVFIFVKGTATVLDRTGHRRTPILFIQSSILILVAALRAAILSITILV